MGCFSSDDSNSPTGYNTSRGCTDILVLLVFVLFWIGYGAVVVIAYTNGDLRRLYRPTDFAGNVCGIDGEPSQPTQEELQSAGGETDWTKRDKIWYPVVPSTDLGAMDVRKLGICVAECPTGPSISLDTINFTTPGGDWYKTLTKMIPKQYSYPIAGIGGRVEWIVLYNSTSFLHRCIPKETIALGTQLGQAVHDFQPVIDVKNWLYAEFVEVVSAWKVLFLCTGLAFVISFVWIFLLRIFVRVMVYLTLLLVLVVLVALTVILYLYSEKVKERQLDDTPDYQLGVKVMSAVVGGVTLLYILIVIVMWKNIQIGINMIKLASRVLTEVFSLIFVPVLFSVFVAGVSLTCLVCAAYLKSSNDLVVEPVDLPNFIIDIEGTAIKYAPALPFPKPPSSSIPSSAPSSVPSSSSPVVPTTTSSPSPPTTTLTKFIRLQSPSLTPSSSSSPTTTVPTVTAAPSGLNNTAHKIQSRVIQDHRFKEYLEAYNMFAYFWGLAFFDALSYMVISFVCVFWYFSAPGDHKSAPKGTVLRAIYWSIRYHVGTLAFGSLLIALIQFARWLLSKFQDRLEKIKNNPTKCAIKCCLCYAECCLAYFERIIGIVNRAAYVLTCIEGSSFCVSAFRAFRLLIANLSRVAVIGLMGDWIVWLSKLLITVANVLVGFLAMTYTSLAPDTVDAVIPLVIIAIVTYVTASVILHVFGTVIDTLVIAFCRDVDMNNGMDKPYFMTSELKEVMNLANTADNKDNFRSGDYREMDTSEYKPL